MGNLCDGGAGVGNPHAVGQARRAGIGRGCQPADRLDVVVGQLLEQAIGNGTIGQHRHHDSRRAIAHQWQIDQRGDRPPGSQFVDALDLGFERFGLSDGRVRVVIENVTPAVDAGRFPIKRVVGDTVDVEADCFGDGHDVVACDLLWRPRGQARWQRTTMAALGNDRWRAAFVVDALGDWEYTVSAWVDPFLSWRHDFARRVEVADVRIAASVAGRMNNRVSGEALTRTTNTTVPMRAPGVLATKSP